MTSDRRSMIGRSIAALDGEGSIEKRSLQDILTDLEALGLDPAASIRAAQSHAFAQSSPASRLLARLDDADIADVDLDALETADIADIQNAVPKGIAVSIATDAKRRSGVPSNVAGTARLEGRVWGIGGSMIGLAACLLLFFIIRPDQQYQIEPPLIEETDNARGMSRSQAVGDLATRQGSLSQESPDSDRRTVAAADAVGSPTVQPEEQKPEPRSNRPAPKLADTRLALESLGAQLTDRAASTTATAKVGPNATASASSPSEPEAGIAEDVAATAAAPALLPSQKPAANPRSPVTARQTDGTITAKASLETAQNQPAKPDQAAVVEFARDVAAWGGEPRAVLLIDPIAAPDMLKSLAERLSERRLTDRLDEARDLLGERPILALMTILRDGEEVDAVITSRETADVVEAINSLTALSDGRDQGLEIVDLP